MPAVRTLADELRVSPHTVAKAYRDLQSDGLIDSHAGRGSFVREFGAPDLAKARREALLTDALRAARRRARSLGFGDADATRRLTTLINQEPCRADVVFVDGTRHIADKYARRLEHHLPDAVSARGLTLGDLAGAAGAAGALGLDAHLHDVYYVVTFARTVSALERLLETDRHEIVTISSEVTPNTIRFLATLPSGCKAVILTEERYIHATLNLIATHSALDASTVPVHTPEDLAGFLRGARKSEVVFYTFSVGDLLHGRPFASPPEELRFDISRDSVEKLRRVLGDADRMTLD